MNLLVNLLSDQTIPNVQFIKEFYTGEEELLFVTTPTMEKKGVSKWILDAVSINNAKVHYLEINPFDLREMRKKLSEFDTDEYDNVFVNVTGGTKTMSLTVFDFFKNKGADIYYLSGKDNQYFKIFPEKKDNQFSLKSHITLTEYLNAYGFTLKESKASGITETYTQWLFNWFTNNKTDNDHSIITELQQNKYRSKGCLLSDVSGLRDFLTKIKFPYENDKLTKYQVKYITGEWFEEYIEQKLIEIFKLEPDYIKSGIILRRKDVENEYDVALILNDKLHLIECKTYIMSKTKPSLPNDTIYKSPSLIKALGIFATPYIFTLNKLSDLKPTIKDRAELMKIKLIGLENLQNDNTIKAIF